MNCNLNDTNDNHISSNVKIGILGGTFDPIHNGHLMIAKAAMQEYELFKIIFIPTGISYMKANVTHPFFRYEMVKRAIEDYPHYEISDIEIKRDGNTYTCDTIAYFKEKYPEAELYCFFKASAFSSSAVIVFSPKYSPFLVAHKIVQFFKI